MLDQDVAVLVLALVLQLVMMRFLPTTFPLVLVHSLVHLPVLFPVLGLLPLRLIQEKGLVQELDILKVGKVVQLVVQ